MEVTGRAVQTLRNADTGVSRSAGRLTKMGMRLYFPASAMVVSSASVRLGALGMSILETCTQRFLSNEQHHEQSESVMEHWIMSHSAKQTGRDQGHGNLAKLDLFAIPQPQQIDPAKGFGLCQGLVGRAASALGVASHMDKVSPETISSTEWRQHLSPSVQSSTVRSTHALMP